MIPDFEVHTVNQNGRAIVFVTGDIDLAVGERFHDALSAAQSESTEVIVDFTGVTFICATGIDVLVRARQALADRRRLRVVAARPSVRRVLEMTRAADLLLEETRQLTWKEVTYRRSGWRQWITDNRSEEGEPLAEIIELGAWAGFGTDNAQYLLEMSGRARLYGSLADAMKGAENPGSPGRLTRRNATNLK